MGETLALHLSDACPNRCVFCMERDAEGKRAVKFSATPAELVNTAADGADKIPGLDRVFLAGGEPTFFKGFMEVVEGVSGLGLKVETVSGGGRFGDPGFSDLYAASGGGAVHLSIHSRFRELHDAMTGRQGAFDNACASGDAILRSGIKLYATVVVSALNHRELPDMTRWLADRFMGLEMIVFYLVRMIGAAEGRQDLVAPLRQIAASVVAAADAAKDTPVAIRDIPACMLGHRADCARTQEFMIWDGQGFSRLAEGRYRRGIRCSLCHRTVSCRGFLASYPVG